MGKTKRISEQKLIYFCIMILNDKLAIVLFVKELNEKDAHEMVGLGQRKLHLSVAGWPTFAM